MSENKLVCRVCGKEYDPCHTIRNAGTFRWQDVACCAEHGMEYLDRIRKSRSPKVEKATPSYKKKTAPEVFKIEEPAEEPTEFCVVLDTEGFAVNEEEKND